MPTPNQSTANVSFNHGPVNQVVKNAATQDVLLATTVPDGATITSNLILSCGYKIIGIGIIADQDGVLSVQRYLSSDNTIKQDGGVPFVMNFTANTNANTLNIVDDKPFQSFTVAISNSSGSLMTISRFILILQAN